MPSRAPYLLAPGLYPQTEHLPPFPPPLPSLVSKGPPVLPASQPQIEEL